MNKKRIIWIASFLGVGLLWVVMELIAAFDKSSDTIPLTHLIRDNIPVWVGLPVIAIFSVWLIAHFIKAYKKKK